MPGSRQSFGSEIRHRASRFLFAVNTLFYEFFMFLASLLPQGLAFRIARQVGTLRYKRRRHGVRCYEARIASVLQVTSEQAESCLKRSFELAACEDLERRLYPGITRESILKLIEIRGLESLGSALDRRGGAILYSPHVRGEFTAFAALGLLGYKPHVVGRPPWCLDEHRMERRLYESRNAHLRPRADCDFMWMHPTNFGVAVQAAHALARNEVVTVAIDNTFFEQNVEARFLNRVGRFPSGPILMSQTSRAPLLSLFIHRENNWTPQIADIGPPFYASEDIVGSVQHCVSQLEEKILQHPSSWSLWLFPEWRWWDGLG